MPNSKSTSKVNKSGAAASAEGTIKMLLDWNERVSSSDQRQLLRVALQKAELIRIQEKYVP